MCDDLSLTGCSDVEEWARRQMMKDACIECGGAGCKFVVTRVKPTGKPAFLTTVPTATACPKCRGTGRAS